MDHKERMFTLRLRDDVSGAKVSPWGHAAAEGELWQGKGRVPVAGVMTYRGRVDAVITFFVDQFLNDEIFQAGDFLALASEKGETKLVLARRA